MSHYSWEHFSREPNSSDFRQIHTAEMRLHSADFHHCFCKHRLLGPETVSAQLVATGRIEDSN